MTGMTVVHGPRRADAGTYDAWSAALRVADPGFAFADPPFRHSLRVTQSAPFPSRRPVSRAGPDL
jgi:hypothetical protein